MEKSQSDLPPYPRTYLIPRLAYRLQEIAYGKLSTKSAKKLDYLADQIEQGKKVSSRNFPREGTQFIREYNGVNYEILVTDKGFTYQG